MTASRDTTSALPGVAPAIATKLATLGLTRPFDLVLHLPLRYEDETRVVPMAAAPHGLPTQVEGIVVDAEVRIRGRRQLVARVRDDTGQLTVRLLHFYPGQQKQLAPGQRVRLAGEIRPAPRGQDRLREAAKLGFDTAIIPSANAPKHPIDGLTVIGVERVEQALEKMRELE